MSNLIINISIGSLHFQVMRDAPWFRVSRNHHVMRAWNRVIVHRFFGYSS